MILIRVACSTLLVASFQRSCLAHSDWDDNWDCLKGKGKGIEGGANHYIVLVRHGQYQKGVDDDVDRTLTPLGKQQAALTGERLHALLLSKQLPPVTKFVASTMIRAKQTADIILPHLTHSSNVDESSSDGSAAALPLLTCNMLREGAVYVPVPAISKQRWDVSDSDFYRDQPRVEAAYRAYQGADTTSVLVCHGNVIRYFLTRALQIDPEAWLRFSVANGSITVIKVTPSGNCSLQMIGCAGFMPADSVTFN
eukprot:GSChrysophyteH2.ASY1.ANO1.869.1 assembled CDS